MLKAGLADFNPGNFNHDFNRDLNQVIFLSKIMRFKSELPVYFESPTCIGHLFMLSSAVG